jgi:hypothetical protein
MEILNLKKVSKEIAEFLDQEYFDLDSTHERTQRLIEEGITDRANSGADCSDSYEVDATFDIKLNVFKFDCFNNKISFETTIEVVEVEIVDEYEYEDGTTCAIYDYVKVKAL